MDVVAQKTIVLRESQRLENFVRRWRWRMVQRLAAQVRLDADAALEPTRAPRVKRPRAS